MPSRLDGGAGYAPVGRYSRDGRERPRPPHSAVGERHPGGGEHHSLDGDPQMPAHTSSYRVMNHDRPLSGKRTGATGLDPRNRAKNPRRVLVVGPFVQGTKSASLATSPTIDGTPSVHPLFSMPSRSRIMSSSRSALPRGDSYHPKTRVPKQRCWAARHRRPRDALSTPCGRRCRISLAGRHSEKVPPCEVAVPADEARADARHVTAGSRTGRGAAVAAPFPVGRVVWMA
jgi:hypothetical protein